MSSCCVYVIDLEFTEVRLNIGASIVTNTILGVPGYNYIL